VGRLPAHRGGALDPSFGSGGFAQPAYDTGEAHGVAIDASGRVLVVGDHDKHASLVRYLPGGALDPAFSDDGRRVVELESPHPLYPNDSLEAVAGTADGGLVATGIVDDGWIGIVRLDATARSRPGSATAAGSSPRSRTTTKGDPCSCRRTAS
jgi:hypothetical protein